MLVNTLGKMPADLFAEFDHTAREDLPAGDVEVPPGLLELTSRRPAARSHLSLAFNPSHLEIVNPVVEGSVQGAPGPPRRHGRRLRCCRSSCTATPAFAGQGVVMETLALAQTRGYYTGGTVHIVINNQIGFTTSDPRDTPLDAVLHRRRQDDRGAGAARERRRPRGRGAVRPSCALDYRQEFNKDVVVDIVCFRKLGHNEQDTPALTQPLMYKKIAQHPGTRKLYADKLAAQGVRPTTARRRHGQGASAPPWTQASNTIDPVLTNFKSKYAVDWSALPQQEVDRRRRHGACRWPSGSAWPSASPRCPTDFTVASAGRRRCWPTAPRWAAARSTSTGAWASTWPSPRWWPAATRCACRARTAAAAPSRTAMRCCTTRTARSGTTAPTRRCRTWPTTRRRSSCIDSILSEEAVLGFEYGYASTDPNTLVIWEAQFGDFVNGAQVVIDQFIASGEVKWGRVNGITLMLPHGYEGQGPEHSSARLERFMQLVGRHQHAGRAADHGQPDLPRAAPPDGAHVPQAAGHHDAQVAAARTGRDLAAVRIHQGRASRP